MTNLQNQIAAEIPNLDCCVLPRELAVMRAEFKSMEAGFKLLASYAEAKENAMVSRQYGKIEQAAKFESAAEWVYQQLPEWARW